LITKITGKLLAVAGQRGFLDKAAVSNAQRLFETLKGEPDLAAGITYASLDFIESFRRNQLLHRHSADQTGAPNRDHVIPMSPQDHGGDAVDRDIELFRDKGPVSRRI